MISLQENGNSKYTLKLSKSFDFETHKEFRDSIKKVIDSNASFLEIDFHEVEYIDSSALGMLMLAKHETDQHKCTLELFNIRDGHAKNILNLVKFDKMFTIREI